jgi:excisionase family DNA binding protein
MSENNWEGKEMKEEEKTTLEVTPNTEEKSIFSITEAARLNNVTRQAIYVAIKQKKLKATKCEARWVIHIDDLEEYRKNKYSRTKSTYEGELLFNNEKGFYSINQTAKMLNVPAQKIYYATRVGHLKAVRKGTAWVMHIDEIKAYKEKYLNRPSVFGVEAS